MSYTTLVPGEALAAHLDDPAWVVFDCRHDLADPGRGRREYAESHIPGARFLHLDEDLSSPPTGTNGRHPLPDFRMLAATFARAGVGPGTQVVGYDDQGGMVAARLWWLLRGLGHERVAVLDGGWGKWTAERRPASRELPAPRPSSWTSGLRPEFVDARFVLSHLGDPGVTLLDARAPDRYRGRNETLDPVGGRIPGARNRFFRDNLDAASGCFKPAAALRTEFAALVEGGGNVVHYCGSGVSACHNLLAMAIAGLPGGRLYAGSWSEWCADRSRPTAAGEPRPEER
jgi:thiosulfate/3-mercaptopyruvate sulfurtransferase